VCGPEVLDGIADYYRFVLDVAEQAHPTGTPPLEVARQTDLARFAHLTDGERFVGNLHRAYVELGGAERGARIDVASAILDMVAYNGGQPLRCLA
jgi:cyclase